MKPLRLVPACLALAALAACDRTPRFVKESADSTSAVPADSAGIYVQLARQLWESPDQGEEAADVSARVVLQDLRVRARDPISDRAVELLDSLHFGAEVVGGGDYAIANLFARSNPSGGSWPYLFARDKGSVRAEALESRGMRLVSARMERAAGQATAPPRLVGLFSRQGVQGQQPFAYAWQRSPDGGWRLVQSLGPDSLGTYGAARLVEPGEDGVVLISRTYQSSRGFEECASCPHVYRTRRFRWGSAGLTLAGEETERSPYASFVALIQALVAGDREAASKKVADPSLLDAATSHEWDRSKGPWRLAPGTPSNARDLQFLRGSQEAYRLHFASSGDDWVLTAFESVGRSIE